MHWLHSGKFMGLFGYYFYSFIFYDIINLVHPTVVTCY